MESTQIRPFIACWDTTDHATDYATDPNVHPIVTFYTEVDWVISYSNVPQLTLHIDLPLPWQCSEVVPAFSNVAPLSTHDLTYHKPLPHVILHIKEMRYLELPCADRGYVGLCSFCHELKL